MVRRTRRPFRAAHLAARARSAPPPPPRHGELRPSGVPATDLRNRPIRLIADADGVLAQGWGGVSVAVPREQIGSVGAYREVVTGSRGGRRTFSSVLVLDPQRRVLLRLTGIWDPAEAAHVVAVAGLPVLPGYYRLSEIRAQLRDRAPGYRKVRARSRLNALWYTLIVVLAILPIALSVSFSDLFGGLGGLIVLVLGYLFCYVVAVRVPRWTRELFASDPEK